jgi:DNA-binding HxlR family transcriptional regulator
MAQVPSVFTNRMVPRILFELSKGPLRFNSLQRAADAPSARMLSQTLKKLEAHGILTRRVLNPGPPAHTLYELSELGFELQKSTGGLLDFWNKNQSEIQQRHFVAGEAARAAQIQADANA